MAFQQRFQDLAPLLGEAEALFPRDRLGMVERVRGAAPVVVVLVFEDRTDGRHGESSFAAFLLARPGPVPIVLQCNI